MRERVRDRWTMADSTPFSCLSGVLINPYALTIGFARPLATYKRANLVLSTLTACSTSSTAEHAREIIFAARRIRDEPGKQLIQKGPIAPSNRLKQGDESSSSKITT